MYEIKKTARLNAGSFLIAKIFLDKKQCCANLNASIELLTILKFFIMITKKELLRLFLHLIDAKEDYRECRSVISDKEYLSTLINLGKIDHSYLSYVIDSLTEAADLTPVAVSKVWDEISPLLYNQGKLTIKKIVSLVYKYQS